MTLVGNRAFADVIRSYWIKSSDWCLSKRRERDFHAQRSHVKMGSDTGVKHLLEGMPGATRSQERHGMDSPIPPEGTNPAGTMIFDFWPSGL